MSITKLPSNRWRAQVWSSREGKNVSVAKVLNLTEPTFRTKAEAKAAREEARKVLATVRQSMTLKDWATIWTTDPLYKRPKQSTNLHNQERIRKFVDRYGTYPLRMITDEVVAEWIAGGKNLGTVPVLKAMFNDAASAKAGRLISVNPFAGLKLSRGKGRANEAPPSEEDVWRMISTARELTLPSFAAWLQVACFTGMRPGELDALQWSAVDLETGRVRVREQFNVRTREMSLPKNGLVRDAILLPPAVEALRELPRESRFCFVNTRGHHFTTSSRSYWWNVVRTAMGWRAVESRKALYLATRHWYGWFCINVLELASEDVALGMGHTDGGEQVRIRYGHREAPRAFDRISDAYSRVNSGQSALRIVKEDGA